MSSGDFTESVREGMKPDLPQPLQHPWVVKGPCLISSKPGAGGAAATALWAWAEKLCLQGLVSFVWSAGKRLDF